jgi:hypothetical protein
VRASGSPLLGGSCEQEPSGLGWVGFEWSMGNARSDLPAPSASLGVFLRGLRLLRLRGTVPAVGGPASGADCSDSGEVGGSDSGEVVVVTYLLHQQQDLKQPHILLQDLDLFRQTN